MKKASLPAWTSPARTFVCASARLFVVLCAVLVGGTPVMASESDADVTAARYKSPERSAGGLDTLRGTFEKDGAWGLLTDNLRWAVDIAGRVNSNENSGYTNQEFFGIDLLKTVSTEKQDIGTLIVQLYVDFHSDAPAWRETWDFKVRMLNFNYFVSPKGGLNLRIGHMLIPYGLNIPSETNGTLRQFGTPATIGHKVDWGTAVNGTLSNFVYEVALSRGSGLDYESKGDPYLVSGRIGTPVERPFGLGTSGLHGKVYKNGELTERTRIGIDSRWQGGPIDALAEVSIGRDDVLAGKLDVAQSKKDVISAFLDLSWRSPSEALLLYTQGHLTMNRLTAGSDGVWDTRHEMTIGAQLALAQHYWISADYRHELTSTGRPDLVRVQLRYRFF